MSMIIDGTAGVTFPNTTVQAGAYNGFSTVIFASSGTWTPPAGVTQARVTVVGGGGGGQNDSNLGPPGYGGYAIAYVTGLSGAITITVGTGGDVGASDGVAGGTSSFGSFVSATGGAGGSGTFGGANGTGIVSTGTALKTGNLVYPSVIPVPLTGQQTVSATTSGEAWSTTSVKCAGTAGLSQSGAAKGGIGGVVMIEY
jgi:hypothetical protein